MTERVVYSFEVIEVDHKCGDCQPGVPVVERTPIIPPFGFTVPFLSWPVAPERQAGALRQGSEPGGHVGKANAKVSFASGEVGPDGRSMIADAREGGSVQVLIAYGSKRGGTAGLAEMIGDELTAAGLKTAVKPAREVRGLDGFDSVVIAGALYATRWHRDARSFARRHAAALGERPVWLVSSGPLDDSAVAGAIPPVRHVAKVMSQIGARGQVTFGGRLEATAKGFPVSAMAKTKAGDWRDRDHVRSWVATVVAELGQL